MLNDFDRITEIKCHRLSALELHNCSHYRMITNYSPPPAFFFFFLSPLQQVSSSHFQALSLSLSLRKRHPLPLGFTRIRIFSPPSGYIHMLKRLGMTGAVQVNVLKVKMETQSPKAVLFWKAWKVTIFYFIYFFTINSNLDKCSFTEYIPHFKSPPWSNSQVLIEHWNRFCSL